MLLDGEGVRALGALLGLAALVGTGEGLRRRGVSAATTRRLVHAGVALFVAATPLLFARPLPVYGLAVLFTIVNAVARARRWWAGIHEARPESWGTVALPLSVLPALAATWSMSPERLLPLHAAYLVLALSDPAASWVGERWQSNPPDQTTTAAGSVAFAGVACALLTGMLVGAGHWALPTGLGAAVGAALVSTAAEAYVTGLVVGPLFVVTALTVVGLVVTETIALLRVVAFGCLPVGTVGFLVCLNRLFANRRPPVETHGTRRPQHPTAPPGDGVGPEIKTYEWVSVTPATVIAGSCRPRSRVRTQFQSTTGGFS